LPCAAAAEKLEWLMSQARMLRLTGVELKEDSPGIAAPAVVTPGAAAPGVAALAATAQKSLDSEPT
jgi:hypothetical protein